MSKRNLRDYGFGDAPKVTGAPVVVEKLEDKCPNCGCKTLFGIEVEVENPSTLLRRPTTPHKVIGAYVGCPACPWASPMMTMTRPVAS
jgi:hypothetical protein